MLSCENKIVISLILRAEHPVGAEDDGLEVEVLCLEARAGLVFLLPPLLDQGPHLRKAERSAHQLIIVNPVPAPGRSLQRQRAVRTRPFERRDMGFPHILPADIVK
jgi:hypothetical protein